jgi:hypothetical protein
VEEVSLHFWGLGVAYRRGDCLLIIELEPESRDLRVHVGKSVREPTGEQHRELVHAWDVLGARDPARDWTPYPMQRGLDNEAIAALLLRWSNGLRELAPELLDACREQGPPSEQVRSQRGGPPEGSPPPG